MIGPTLSRMERERVNEAAKLSGIRWTARGMKLTYSHGGKEHFVLSAGSRRVFDAFCRQVEKEVLKVKGL